jgi:hypothetical protein
MALAAAGRSRLLMLYGWWQKRLAKNTEPVNGSVWSEDTRGGAKNPGVRGNQSISVACLAGHNRQLEANRSPDPCFLAVSFSAFFSC